MDNNGTLNVVSDKTNIIATNIFAKRITDECPICKKDYEKGRYIWNVDNGTIAGKIICEDCEKFVAEFEENKYLRLSGRMWGKQLIADSLCRAMAYLSRLKKDGVINDKK